MERYMREQLTDTIVTEAALCYAVSKDSLQLIGGFENSVYEYQKDDKAYIMRFVHSDHRTYQQVLAELEFVDYLHKHGARVSNVLHSISDQIVEQIAINTNQYFSVSVFDKAPGTYVKRSDLTPEFWTMFGREVGRLHRLSKTFHPTHKRFHWHEENFSEIAARVLEDDDQDIATLYQQVSQKIMSLPITSENYGLIHTDLHFHNMYYHEGELTFFDFDDTAYKHYLSDIAIIIYYNFMGYDTKPNPMTYQEYNQEVKQVLYHFLKGYQVEYSFDKDFFRYFNDFLLLRSVILYIVVVASGYKHDEDENKRRFCSLIKQRALNHSMKLDLDFVLGS